MYILLFTIFCITLSTYYTRVVYASHSWRADTNYGGIIEGRRQSAIFLVYILYPYWRSHLSSSACVQWSLLAGRDRPLLPPGDNYNYHRWDARAITTNFLDARRNNVITLTNIIISILACECYCHTVWRSVSTASLLARAVRAWYTKESLLII